MLKCLEVLVAAYHNTMLNSEAGDSIFRRCEQWLKCSQEIVDNMYRIVERITPPSCNQNVLVVWMTSVLLDQLKGWGYRAHSISNKQPKLKEPKSHADFRTSSSCSCTQIQRHQRSHSIRLPMKDLL